MTKTKIGPLKRQDGSLTKNDEEVASELNKQYQTAFSVPRKEHIIDDPDEFFKESQYENGRISEENWKKSDKTSEDHQKDSDQFFEDIQSEFDDEMTLKDIIFNAEDVKKNLNASSVTEN